MNPTFVYNGTELRHFDASYNSTILNERACEVTIASDWLAVHTDRPVGTPLDVLELGNVMNHYPDEIPPSARERRVVDKYEAGGDVENLDVFDVKGRFDVILSISTIEHVGNEARNGPINLVLAANAFMFLTSLLKPGGRMMVTWPTGYHRRLDEWMLGLVGVPHMDISTMVRDEDGWRQTETPELREYGRPWVSGNGVFIVEYRRPE